MTHKKIFRTSLTILILLVIAGMIFYPKLKPLISGSSQGSIQPGPRGGRGGQQKLLASGYVIVPSQMFEIRKSTSSLLPDEEVELSFETSGKVVGIYFDEGTRVKKGDLLAKINDRPLQAQLLKLQAQLKLTEEKEFRQRQLLDRDAISRESYDQISTELQALQADIMLIEARIAEIEFSIPERYAGEVTPGFPITFTIDGVAEEFGARVYAVDPKINIETRTIVVRALYPNRNEELKPGRYASVTALLSQIDSAVSIPTEAIIPEMDGEKVFVYRNGKAEQVKVVTGLRTESQIQIREGLNFGDTLLTTATLQLRHLLPVELDTLVTNGVNQNL